MQLQLFPSSETGKKNLGWLRSNFYFSFSDYANPARSAFGTLVAFNDDYVEPGKGFGLHPHLNMEIVSILLKGSMNHKDSMGYSSILTAGAVQIMSAGAGLRHEEYNVGEEEVNFLQIWVQPKIQNILPRYQSRYFTRETRHNQLQTIVSYEEGAGHCWINQNARLSMGWFDAGKKVVYDLQKHNSCVFLFVISGSLQVEQTLLGQRDAIGIWDTALLEFTCVTEAEFLLIETPVNQK